MELPFRNLHELYKICYERAEARAKAEQEKQEEEERKRQQEEDEERRKKGLPPIIRRAPPPDAKKVKAKQQDNVPSMLSPDDVDDFEEMLEDMAEGGAI